jgi:hypothetical protein
LDGRQSIIEVRPIYGWGWIVAGKPRFEVPAPFRMRLEVLAAEAMDVDRAG